MLQRLLNVVQGGGDGGKRNDSPIDIHYQRVVEIVVGSGKWKREEDWQESLEQLQEKVSHLRTRLPEQYEEVREFHYFQCKKVLEWLEKSAGDGAKTWFGSYKDTYLAEWAEVVKTYEKTGLFLGETANILERNLTWEIPFQRTRIGAIDKEVKDIHKKIQSQESTIREHQHNFHRACEQRGLNGIDLAVELKQQCSKIPSLLNEILRELQGQTFTEILAYREAILDYNFEKQPHHDLELKTILEVRAFSLDEDGAEEPGSTTASTIENMTVEITDWSQLDLSNLVEMVNENEEETTTSEKNTINWDIELTQPVHEIIETYHQQKQHRLMDQRLREALYNELLELDGFLSQRITETKSAASMWFVLENMPQAVRVKSAEDLQAALEAVRKLIRMVTDEQLIELLLIQEGGKAFHRILEDLEKQKNMGNKLRLAINKAEAKASQLLQQRKEHMEELKYFLGTTKELKLDLESTLTEIFHNRKVSILGTML